MTSESVKDFKRLCFLLISEKHTHKRNSLQVRHGKYKHSDDIYAFEIVNVKDVCVCNFAKMNSKMINGA